MLLYLVKVALPLIAIITLYVSWLSRTRREGRQRFIAAYAGQRLVQARHNRQLIYAVLNTDESGAIRQMQLVWTLDGPSPDSQLYSNVDQNTVVKFDQHLFAEG